MDSYDKKEMWSGYVKNISRLISQMDDDIVYRLTANHWSGLEKDDPDIEHIADIMKELQSVRESLVINSQSASRKFKKEQEERERVYLWFEAWENGLCPKECCKSWMRYELSEIAEYKRDTGNLREDTISAIIDYEDDNHICDNDYRRVGYPDDEPFRPWKVI